MAQFHCQIKPISRGQGRSAIASAAYRSAEKIYDIQTGQMYDFTRKSKVLETRILAPKNEHFERVELWTLAAQKENRKDAREAREFEVGLPKDLPLEESKKIAYNFAQKLVDRFGVAADVCIHKSGAGDERNLHAHIMVTTRKVVGHDLTEKSDLELADHVLKKRGLPTGREQLKAIRKEWANTVNIELQKYGIAPISHLSLKDQGIDRKPQQHLGPHAAAMERRGISTRIGNENRAVKGIFTIDEQREQFFAERQLEISGAREAHFEALREEISLSYKQPVAAKQTMEQLVEKVVKETVEKIQQQTQQPQQPVPVQPAQQAQREAPQMASKQPEPQIVRVDIEAEKAALIEQGKAAYAEYKKAQAEEAEKQKQIEREQRRQERRYDHGPSQSR